MDLNFSFIHAFFLNFAIRGAHSLIFVYTSEVYPTALRASGLGLAASIARVTGILSPILGALLLQQSLQAPLIMYSCAFFVASIVSLMFPLETAGRVLHDSFESQPQQQQSIVMAGGDDELAIAGLAIAGPSTDRRRKSHSLVF
eukprot:c5743_g1_i1.p2 GENE.c5743_g1_i1~~c5743_g1_i1.p2  ORF type:complete len:144 (+),score=40.07 c5743_g1_i1:509-940(+)